MIELINDMCENVMPEILKRGNCIVVTDPPFNVGYKYNTYKDNRSEEEYYEWLSSILGNGMNPCVVIHYPESLYRLSFQMGVFPERVVSWVYNSNTARQHRDIAYFGVSPCFKQVLQPYKNLTDKRIKERISRGLLGCKLYDWFNINQVKNVSKKATNGITHPCMMPVEVMKNVVGILPDGFTIVDPFMGSGTTGIACKMLGRDFIGIEMDETYYQISKERIDCA